MNDLAKNTLIVFAALLLVYLLIKIIKAKLSAFLKQFFAQSQISGSLRKKSEDDFEELKKDFEKKFKRKPTRNETVSLIVHSSHLSVKDNGFKGHFLRQKIRKHLSEKHGIIKNYIIK